MRKYRTDTAFEAAATARSDAPAYWVCLALLLAVVALAARIASVF